MDKDNSSKPKPRPLPAAPANANQRSNTPVDRNLSPQPSPSLSSTYTNTNPPPLPSRNKTPGSSHTITRISPPLYQETPSVRFKDDELTEYREPELVQDETLSYPPSIHIENADTGGWGNTDTTWDQQITQNWDPETTSSNWLVSTKTFEVPIEGRSFVEETNWWDPDDRALFMRPGPGILPPLLDERLHDSDHSLFNVNIDAPKIDPSIPTSSRSNASSQGHPDPRAMTASPRPPAPPPPTEQEIRAAVPHPNAYYCPKDNSWIFLTWKSSPGSPALAPSFLSSARHILPDEGRRHTLANCMDEPGKGRNRAHHFHKYSAAVDAQKLTVPFKTDQWDAPETRKKKRRVGTLVAAEDIDHERMRTDTPDIGFDDDEEVEGKLLDLYVCCQCELSIVASGRLPGVIPGSVWFEFCRDKLTNPAVGKTGESTLVIALETVLTCADLPLDISHPY